jgi:hypothetical protein
MQGKTPFWHQQSANRDEKGRGAALQKHNQQLCWTSLLDWILLVIPLTLLRIEPPHGTVPVPQTLAQHAQVLLIRLWITWKHGLAMEQLACRSYSNLKIAIRICRDGCSKHGFYPIYFLFGGAWNSSHPIQESVEQVAAAALAATQDRNAHVCLQGWVVSTTIITFQQEQIMWKSWMRSSR